jgi:integrase
VNARVIDLERVHWSTIKANWGRSSADWNHMRRAVSTFLTSLLGDKYHPFRRKIVQAIPLAHEGSGREPDLTPADFVRIVAEMPSHARPAVWVLVLTGMRVGEYLRTTKADLMSATCGVRVPGTKTHGSAAPVYVDERMWPWIEAGVPAPLQHGWIRKYWKRACAKLGFNDITLHDLRHCHGQWAVDEGIPESKVQVSLRHSTVAMTRRYVKKRSKREVAKALGDALSFERAS